jgi:hypothetical protein
MTSAPCRRGFANELAKGGFTELYAGGVKVIDEPEQLPLPADDLGAGLSATAIVLGHVMQGLAVLWLGREVPRPPWSAVGEDGAFMQVATAAAAGRLAALAPQGIQGAGQERQATEAGLEQAGQEFLKLEKLGAAGAQVLVHEGGPWCERAVCMLYI